MKMALSAMVAILALPGLEAVAQDPNVPDVRITYIRFHRVHLRNGNVIDGDLVGMNDREALLKLGVGEMAIRRGQIEKIEYIKMRSISEKPPIVMPKPVVPKPSALNTQPVASANPTKAAEPIAPLPTPVGVPEALRLNADAILAVWTKGGVGDRELSRQFQALGADIVPYLAALLEHRTKSVPVTALAHALGTLGDPRAIAGLGIGLHSSEEGDARKECLIALIKLSTSETTTLIMDGLNDPSSDVWKLAKEHLVGRFKKKELEDLPDQLIFRMGSAQNKLPYALTLGALDNQAAHRELLALLSSGSEFDQRAAVQALSLKPTAEDGPAVMRVLLDRRDRMLQQEAALFMGKAKFTAAVPELIQLLREDVQGVVSNAHWSLKEITGEKFGVDAAIWEQWFENSALKKEIQK